MSSERWQRAWSLFEAALDLPAADRESFLRSKGGKDDALLQAVHHWLEADREASRFLDGGVLPNLPSSSLNLVGRHLGSYAIQEEIGQGGMGTVYLARQKDETFDRNVALKVLTTAPFGHEARRRFQFERQALASLDHPAIARILDGGTTEEGVPYLVLEYVPGRQIDQFCNELQLSVEERVCLFRRVCQAVAAAHRNLIVHRDLKPSNILVREDGQPKLLDFGIAKLVAGEGSGEPTHSWSRPFTPRYASPEQIRGERVSIGTDVFSLGVLLYEILGGVLPFEARSEDLSQLLEEIEKGPPTPSNRVSGRPHLARQLQGDLDSIVLKALRPEVNERYASVDQLDEDLGRYLEGQPVQARSGSRRYRAAKFLRRNRWPAALLATLILGLASLVAVLWLTNARLSAERGKQKEVVDFFLEVFERAGPFVSAGGEVTVKEAIDQSATSLGSGLRAQPAVRAALAAVLGDIYLDLGDSDAALVWSQEALALHRSLEGEASLAAAESQGRVGAALRGLERMDESLQATSEALDGLRRAPGVSALQLIRGINNQVEVYCRRYEFEIAGPLALEALQRARVDLSPKNPETHTAFLHHASVLRNTGDLEGAIRVYGEAQTLLEQLGAGVHPELPGLHNNLAGLLRDQGNHGAAREHLMESDRLFAQLFGDDFYERVIPLSALAGDARRAGDSQRAVELYREAARIGRLTSSPSYVLRPVLALASLLIRSNQCEQAEVELRASLARLLGRSEPSSRAFIAQCLLGASLACQGRFAEAEPLLQRSLEELAAADKDFPELCQDALNPLLPAVQTRP